jgi:hypothetical protein
MNHTAAINRLRAKRNANTAAKAERAAAKAAANAARAAALHERKQNANAIKAARNAELARRRVTSNALASAARANRAGKTQAVANRLAKVKAASETNLSQMNALIKNLNKRNNKTLPLTRPEIKNLLRGAYSNRAISQAYINRYNKLHTGKTSARSRVSSLFRGGSTRASTAAQGLRGFFSSARNKARRAGNVLRTSRVGMSRNQLIDANNEARKARNNASQPRNNATRSRGNALKNENEARRARNQLTPTNNAFLTGGGHLGNIKGRRR